MATPRRLRASGLIETRDGTPANKDSRLYNAILEPNGEEVDFLKRTGYSSLFSPATGIGQGAILSNTANGTAQILSIVSNQLCVTTKTVSSTWTVRTSAQAGQLRAVAWSPSLGMFAAVGDTGTNRVQTSTNGTSWSVQSEPTGANFFGIAWSPALGMFAAVSNNGGTSSVITSTDGVTWTARTTPNKEWIAIAWSPELGMFAAVANNNGGATDKVMTSTDGITWTSRTAANNNRWRGITWSPELGLFCAVAILATANHVMTSPNGTTWTGRTASANNDWYAVAWSPSLGMFAAVGNSLSTDCIMTSYDSITWTSRTTTAAKNFQGVAWSPDSEVFAAVCTSGAANRVAISTDGITWTDTASPATQNWVGVAWSPSLNLFAAVAATPSTANVMTGTAVVSYTTINPTGASLSGTGLYDFSQTLDRTKIAIKNTTGAWEYNVAAQTLTQVNDADYPSTTVRGLVYLNGVFYVMDTYGNIYGSGTNDFTTWTALNKVVAQSEPDGGVCLIKYNQYPAAFGEYTTQFFFNDTQNAVGSPLSPVQNSDLLIGCVNGDCVTQAQASVFFPARSKALGQSSNPRIFIAELSGMSYKRVSTPDIDRILNADGLDGAWSLFMVWLGHPCYMITLPVTGYTLVYDLAQPNWYIFTKQTASSAVSVSSITCAAAYAGATIGVATATTASAHGFSDGDPVLIAGANQSAYNGTFNITYISTTSFSYKTTSVPVTATGTITATGSTADIYPALCAFNYDGTQIFQNQLNGGIYTMSDTLYTDDGNYIDWKIRTMRFDQGLSEQGNSQNKFMPWIDYISDKTSSETNVLIRWTDDDYQTYSNYRAVDISLSRSRLSRCGAFLRRAFEFRHTANAAHRMQGIDVGLEQGGE